MRREARLVVFAWHNVAPTWFAPWAPDAGRRGLARQLAVVRRAFRVLPLSRALHALHAGLPLPPRAAALTFDDGYRDNLEVAAPLLARLGLPATFFLVPSLLDGGPAWWETAGWAFGQSTRSHLRWDGVPWSLDGPVSRRNAAERACERLKDRDEAARRRSVAELTALLECPREPADGLFLDWDAARRLARLPGVEIGSHSRDHAILSRESGSSQREDLAEARRALESRLGVECPALAYPNGTAEDYDRWTIAAARAAGHRWALTTRAGVNRPGTPPYELRRVMLAAADGVPGLMRAAGRPWRERERRAQRPAATRPRSRPK